MRKKKRVKKNSSGKLDLPYQPTKPEVYDKYPGLWTRISGGRAERIAFEWQNEPNVGCSHIKNIGDRPTMVDFVSCDDCPLPLNSEECKKFEKGAIRTVVSKKLLVEYSFVYEEEVKVDKSFESDGDK